MGMPALVPPVRCARCRSPLWNTPRVNKKPSKERKEKQFQLECDRDGWERLYRSEHEKVQRLEAEVARLTQRLNDAEKVIQEQFNDLISAQRAAKYYQNKAYGVNQ
jgi:hypothetical protein